MANKPHLWWTPNCSWNPIKGCTKIADGCKNCYAETMAIRLKGMGQKAYQDVVDDRVCPSCGGCGETAPWDTSHSLACPTCNGDGCLVGWTGELFFDEKTLEQPLRWKKPRRIFCGSMTDIFHENMPYRWIEKVLGCIRDCPQHTFIIVTKRAGLMVQDIIKYSITENDDEILPNLHLGISVSTQKDLDGNIQLLLDTPAAVRWISLAPMLGPIDITPYIGYNAYKCECGWHDTEMNLTLAGCVEGNRGAVCKKCGDPARIYRACNWLVIESESGPNARPFKIEWAEKVAHQCREANVPLFVKQLTIDGTMTHDISKFPKELQRRELPR